MAQGQPTKVKKKKKSVLKRAAQARQRAQVNRINRTRVRTMMRRFRTALTAGDPTAAGNLLYRSEEHTSELQSHSDLVCRLLLEKKKKKTKQKKANTTKTIINNTNKGLL